MASANKIYFDLDLCLFLLSRTKYRLNFIIQLLENFVWDVFLFQACVFIIIIREAAQGTHYKPLALIGLSLCSGRFYIPAAKENMMHEGFKGSLTVIMKTHVFIS